MPINKMEGGLGSETREKTLDLNDELRIIRARLTGESFPNDLVDKTLSSFSEMLNDTYKEQKVIEELMADGYIRNESGIFEKK